jgi:NAD(P)-dependent dehydrogenase (short-subunit alcohol dehydrogenase family)
MKAGSSPRKLEPWGTKKMTRTWCITGASSGFGRIMTEKLLARGDRVAATLRKTGALDDLSSKYGDRLWIGALDVSDSRACHRVVADAFAAMGRIDVIVSNAGYGLYGAAEELSSAQIRAQIDTNLIGSMEVIRAALPHLRDQGGGRIIQVSSEGGQIAYPNFSAYHASKWGIEGFVEAVALEVAPFGIEFTLAEPGPAGTSFGASRINAPALAAYENTPSAEGRRRSAAGTAFVRGDAAKMAQAMIDSVERTPAPRRLVMGGGSYTRIRAALLARLAELDAQRELAESTDCV